MERPLIVVGGARYETEYSRNLFALAGPKVRFLGPVYEPDLLNGLYKNCYLYLHGHEVGGTNPSLLRAMDAGAACVPIDVSFHKEVLGDGGAFFSATVGDLARLLGELESDPERVKSLGARSLDRSNKLYRWDAVAAGYADLFGQIIRAKAEGVPCSERIQEEVYHPEKFVT